MTYIKINDSLIEATIRGYNKDKDWDERQSKAITCAMTYEEALALFVDDLQWSIVYQGDPYIENEETITPEPEEYDNSEYSIAGPITDNRNGTVTVKMGKLTAEELLAIIQEAL